MIWILANPATLSANKRMLSDWFSASLQTSRKCGRYTFYKFRCKKNNSQIWDTHLFEQGVA